MSAFGTSRARYGKTVNVYIYLGDDAETPPAEEDFLLVGGSRGISRSKSYETRDTTNRDTTGKYQTSATTWKTGESTIDGLVFENDSVQSLIQEYFDAPEESAQNVSGNPNVWLRFVERVGGTGANEGKEVIRITDEPSMITSIDADDPHDDNSTYSLSFNTVGDPVKTEELVNPAP